MKILRAFLLLLCAASLVSASDATRKVTYARGNTIFIANLDGEGAKKVATGAGPDLSADGTRITFNTEDPKSPERHIAIADLATGKVTRIPNIPSDNCFGPIWSPDDSQIIFYIFTDSDWHLGIIKPDGSDFHYVRKSEKAHSFYSVAWAPDGRSFYCQDLDSLFRMTTEGTVQKKWALSKLFPHGSFNSGAKFSCSTDGNTLLMDVDMDENVSRKDWDGPPPSIWSLDIPSEKATRLTAKGLFAWEPEWLNATEFLCVIQPSAAKEASIYRVSADGKVRQPLIKNARNPDVSR